MELLDDGVEDEAVGNVEQRLEPEDDEQHYHRRMPDYADINEEELEQHHEDDGLVVANAFCLNLLPLQNAAQTDERPD
jgi:hypothetical protein